MEISQKNCVCYTLIEIRGPFMLKEFGHLEGLKLFLLKEQNLFNH